MAPVFFDKDLELIYTVLVELKAEVASLNTAVLKALAPKIATSIVFEFQQRQGAKNVLTAPLNTANEKYFIIGKDSSTPPISGASLGPGQTITVASSDPTIVTFVPDTTAGKDAEGVQSVASGTVNFVALGTVPVSATVNNPDGTVAETLSDTITVTAAVPGVATSIGALFEGGVSGN